MADRPRRGAARSGPDRRIVGRMARHTDDAIPHHSGRGATTTGSIRGPPPICLPTSVTAIRRRLTSTTSSGPTSGMPCRTRRRAYGSSPPRCDQRGGPRHRRGGALTDPDARRSHTPTVVADVGLHVGADPLPATVLAATTIVVLHRQEPSSAGAEAVRLDRVVEVIEQLARCKGGSCSE